MKDNTYHVKHDLCGTSISFPEEGIPIKLNINMTFLTFSYLLTLVFAIGFTVVNVMKWFLKMTGG